MKSKFYCDIWGTFSGTSEPNDEDVQKFAQLLNELDDSEEMSFSFITTDDVDRIKYCMEVLKKYIEGSKVKFGIQYSDTECLDGDIIKPCPQGKISQAMYELDNKEYDYVYYADDTDLLRFMMNGVIVRKKYKFKYQEFKPGKKTECLKGLNIELEQYIKENGKRRNI